jgi:SdrD B-like domain
LRESLAIGNLVWNDLNNNGIKDPAEPGVGGATVQLFTTGADNAIGGTGEDEDIQVGADFVTTTSGLYQFGQLIPGKYFVKVTPPSLFPLTSGTPVLVDNGVNNDNNGHQPGGLGQPLFSPVVDLSVGEESTNDGDADTSTEMSIDFGLFQGITIGDIVWHDLNNDGLRTGGELGIAGVNVDLMNPGADGQVGGSAAIVASTVTNASGVYGFTVFSPGSYFVRVEAPVATPVVSSYRVTSDNGVNNDNNGVQPGGLGTPAYGPIVSLLEGQEPGTDGATNFETTIDFGFRACPAIAISPSSMPEAMQGLPTPGHCQQMEAKLLMCGHW